MGDERERHALVLQWLPWGVRIATRYYRAYRSAQVYLEREDLHQEAVIGLLTAADRFDPSRGVQFATYASWWIRNAVSRAVRGCTLVRVPDHLWRPDQEDDDESMKKRLFHARRAQSTVNMDEEWDIPARPENTPDWFADAQVREAFEALDPRRQKVLACKFGLGEPELPCKVVAAQLGVTESRVKQLAEEGLFFLREWMRGPDPGAQARCVHVGANGARCQRLSREDGRCRIHHPQRKLNRLQKQMSALWDRASKSGRGWREYEVMEGRERELIREVEELRRAG